VCGEVRERERERGREMWEENTSCFFSLCLSYSLFLFPVSLSHPLCLLPLIKKILIPIKYVSVMLV